MEGLVVLLAADDDLLVRQLGQRSWPCWARPRTARTSSTASAPRITQRLIEEQGFNAVAVEADWPDAYRVNRYVRGRSATTPTPTRRSRGFERFPTWMWRNTVVLDFVDWLREHNATRPDAQQVGLLRPRPLQPATRSIDAVLGYLDRVDPEAAQRARSRYACFEHFGEDSQAYGYAASFGLEPSRARTRWSHSCVELHAARGRLLRQRDGRVAEDELFYAEQNARLVRNAEEYYRTMFRGRVSSWNLRDRTWPRRWTRSSTTSDAAAGQAEGRRLGAQLAPRRRARHRDGRRGRVERRPARARALRRPTRCWSASPPTAAPSPRPRTGTAAPNASGCAPACAAATRTCSTRPARSAFCAAAARQRGAAELLREPRLERAIGVIYRPRHGAQSHYFDAAPAGAVRRDDPPRRDPALEPLEREPLWQRASRRRPIPSGL